MTWFRRLSRRRKWAVCFFALLLALTTDFWIFPLFPDSSPSANRHQNAIWLAQEWSQGKSKESVPALVQRLRANQIRDAYFFVRYIGQSGRLRFPYHSHFRQLNHQFHQKGSGLRSFAWVFIGNERAITGVDISQPKIRALIVGELKKLALQDGFDGIQIDYEICSDGAPDFLKLLSETRAALPHTVLSVATPMWLPSPLGAYGWSEAYFSKVASHCDQIAVMSYDSALYFPRHYVWLVSQQAQRVPRAALAGNPDITVQIGVPTYEKGGLSHWARVENLAMGLRGVRNGAAKTPSPALGGAAIFADYTTDASEWKLWQRDWLNTSH